MCQELACKFYGTIVPLTVSDKTKMSQDRLSAYCVHVIKQIKYSNNQHTAENKHHVMFSFPMSSAKTPNLCKAKSKRPLTVTPRRTIHQISLQLSITIVTVLHKCEGKPESCGDQAFSETIDFSPKQINTTIFMSEHL